MKWTWAAVLLIATVAAAWFVALPADPKPIEPTPPRNPAAESIEVRAATAGQAPSDISDEGVPIGARTSVPDPVPVGPLLAGTTFLVVDADRKPVPDAIVTVLDLRDDEPALATLRTDADGRCETAFVCVDVRVFARNEHAKSEVRVLGSDDIGHRQRLELRELARLTGEVLDPHGSPVARAQVSIQISETRRSRLTLSDASHFQTVQTDDLGTFDAAVEAEALYYVQATHDDRSAFAESVRVDAASTHVVLQLRGARTIRGFLVAPHGNTMRNGRWIVQEDRRGRDPVPFTESGVADASGAFTIEVPRSGEYIVRAETQGYRSTFEALTVTDTLPHVEHDIVLQQLVSIAGTIVDRSGAPVQRNQVNLVIDETQRLARESPTRSALAAWQTASTDATGRFRFDHVHPDAVCYLDCSFRGHILRYTPQKTVDNLRVSPGDMNVRFVVD